MKHNVKTNRQCEKNEFNHKKTPTALREVNERLLTIFEEGENDDVESSSNYKQLSALLTIRDATIKQHLDSLQSEEKQQFAKLELDVNNTLIELAQRLLTKAKDDITHFVRSQSAVKKYK